MPGIKTAIRGDDAGLELAQTDESQRRADFVSFLRGIRRA
jgi:hypothetical protein